MWRKAAKALIAAALLLAPRAATASELGRPPPDRLVIETHDCCATPGFPDTETFAWRHDVVVVQLSFDPQRQATLRSLTMRCQGRAKSFQIDGDYYALWNRPIVWIDDYPQVRFTLPVAASRTATSPDHVLTVECQNGRITEWLAEYGEHPR